MRIESEIKPIETEVLPSWFDAYLHANRNHPQTTYGIYTLVGNEILSSLVSGAVDLEYVAKSKLTPVQFGELINSSIKAHEAMKIDMIPEGFSTGKKSTFDPDFWFNGTWEDIKRSTIRAISYVAAGQDPWQPDRDSFNLRVRSTGKNIKDTFHIDYLNASPAHRLAFNLRSSDSIVDRYLYPSLEKFTKSPVYNEALIMVSKMYQSAAVELETPENKELARIRRELFSKWKRVNHNEIESWVGDYEKNIIRNLLLNIEQFCIDNGLTNEQALCFIGVITSIHRNQLLELDKTVLDIDYLNSIRPKELR